jgi:hypothetical protein
MARIANPRQPVIGDFKRQSREIFVEIESKNEKGDASHRNIQ